MIVHRIETLQHDIRLVRFVNFHHLNLVDLCADEFGEGCLAYFALEFSKVVSRSKSLAFLLNLIVNPLP